MRADFYQLSLADRRRLLADEGFVRDEHHIWVRPDGKAIGEGVAAAITDQAFYRFLGIEPALSAEDESGAEPGLEIDELAEIERAKSGV